jgi:hypothetical protein
MRGKMDCAYVLSDSLEPLQYLLGRHCNYMGRGVGIMNNRVPKFYKLL